MNILNILEGIEKLLVELLLWIIFIPKTLFKIIADPDWVSSYVEKELNKESGKFSDTISPILLLLITSAVLFLIWDTIDIDASFGTLPRFDEAAQALQGQKGALTGLGFLSLPLFFALVTELLQRKELTRKNIRRIWYIQCFYFSPLLLSFFAFSLFTYVLPEEEWFVTLSGFVLALGILIWFLFVEIRLIARELKSGILKAIVVWGGASFLFIVGVGILLSSTDPQSQSGLGYLIGYLYVAVIGWAIIKGFRSLTRRLLPKT